MAKELIENCLTPFEVQRDRDGYVLFEEKCRPYDILKEEELEISGRKESRH